MSVASDSCEDSFEDLFEDAPCGYLATSVGGTITRVNRTFEQLTGFGRLELVGVTRFQELLSPGGRIYHETHVDPLLRMQGSVREIAVEIVCRDGTRLPVFINSMLQSDAEGHPYGIRTVVIAATDRRRYEAELLSARRRDHDIALNLQRSMLGGSMPAAEGLDVAYAYRPAESTLEIGGDWYDAFWLDGPERVGFVLGDVVGRGIDAAATMGQLRSAVRAIVSRDAGPALVLDSLDDYARRHQVGTFATLVVADLDLTSRVLRYACAGHPPPLLCLAGEQPRFLWDGRSLALDVAPAGPHVRGEGTESVADGGTLVLYSDGLVERRERPIDEGMEAMRARLAELAGHSAQAIADGFVRDFDDAEHADDVCVLVVVVA